MSDKPEMNDPTNHLLTMPSFLDGFGQVLDISGDLDEDDLDEAPEVTDEKAIYSDFCAVGADMWAAIHQFERELERGTR